MSSKPIYTYSNNSMRPKRNGQITGEIKAGNRECRCTIMPEPSF